MRTRSFLTDRAHEAAASQAHGEVFADVRPASTMLVVAGLLDERWVIEVELDAVLLTTRWLRRAKCRHETRRGSRRLTTVS